MKNKELARLMAGFRRFRERYFLNENGLYEQLAAAGQSPKTLIIGCSDSRVDPAILTSSGPGELFVVRNIANLVPPYESAGNYHGVSSAIEFAVVNLKVENIVVLGHRQCGGIRNLMCEPKAAGFVGNWVQIAQPAKERVLAQWPQADLDSQLRHCEMESIIVSLENLKTFPFIQDALRERPLYLMGAYFDIEQGHMFELDDETGEFRQILI